MNRPFDRQAFLMGVTFMALSVLFLADQSGHMQLDLSILGPLLFIVFGVGSVWNGVRKSKDSNEDL